MQENVGAAALNHVAGRAVHGAAVKGDQGQRRTHQVRQEIISSSVRQTIDFTLLLSSVAAEVCRLRWSWFYLILLHCLDSINYSSPLPSFHQFVANPTAQQLNGTGRPVR